MVQGQWFAPGKALPGDVISIRHAVFGRSEDERDPLSWNALIYSDGVPAATGRIWWADDAYWLGDLCVLKAFRGQKIGDLLLRLLLFKAQSHAAREVRLICPPDVAGFFSRLGFQAEPGPDPRSVLMLLPGDQIVLDSCRSCPKGNCPGRKE
jgi:GNAT superfamily N-acetyltransferase